MTNASTVNPTVHAATGDHEGSRASALTSTQGTTTIADTVVRKIAGLATHEVPGVYSLGGGTARAFGAIRDRIPGAAASAGQGVSVEVGDTQAAVDLQVLVEYGYSIAGLSNAIRGNVITAIEQMTGLQVVEVNISVTDVHLPGEEEPAPDPHRVV
ncbi:Asp23/Gls24 family envelope stress response protein [Saccharothrix sp. AJ9571]|nr:Asp23/Gls24 family envelope stress response protein [Saccharothrix sp. AJ9571]